MARKLKALSNFKSTLDELSQLVETLEKGDLPLEQSLEYFEKGIQLTRNCQKILQSAEQKIQILLENNDGSHQLDPYQDD